MRQINAHFLTFKINQNEKRKNTLRKGIYQQQERCNRIHHHHYHCHAWRLHFQQSLITFKPINHELQSKNRF